MQERKGKNPFAPPARPREFDDWINQKMPGTPNEFRDHLYETVIGIAHFLYVQRGGGESTEEQKDGDFITAQDIAFEIYKLQKKPIEALRAHLNGGLASDFTEEKYYEHVFNFSRNGKSGA